MKHNECQEENQGKIANLSSEVLEDLRNSGLSEKTIADMQVFQLKGKDDYDYILGFSSIAQQSIPQACQGYAIPYPSGNKHEKVFCRVKILPALSGADGSKVKYLSPIASDGKRWYYLNRDKGKLEKAKNIIITEGEKKTACLSQSLVDIPDFVALGAPGVWNFGTFKGTLAGKRCFICFDMDMSEKRLVLQSAWRLALTLFNANADVFLMSWAGYCKGIDDFLSQFEGEKHRQDELFKLVASALETPFFSLFSGSGLSADTICREASKIKLSGLKLDQVHAHFELKNYFAITKSSFLTAVKSFRKNEVDRAKQEETSVLELAIVASPEKAVRLALDNLEVAIHERAGATYILKNDGFSGKITGEKTEKLLASFTCRMHQKIKDNETGDIFYRLHVKPISSSPYFVDVPGKEWIEPREFRACIARRGQGDYFAKSLEEHQEFLIWLRKQAAEMPEITHLERFGKTKFGFVFENAIVDEAGEVSKIEDCGLFVSENSLNPRLYVVESIEKRNQLVRQAMSSIDKIFGVQSWKILGFAVATLFSDSVFRSCGGFPILFLSGRHATGKTSTACWLQSLTGTSRIKPFTIDSTRKSMLREAHKFVNMSLAINEFSSSEKNNLLLCSLFDRESYKRAKKDNSFETITSEINSTFIVLSTQSIQGLKGEDVLSRMISVDFERVARRREEFGWLQDNRENLSAFVIEVFSRVKASELLEKIKVTTRKLRESLSESASERTISNVAILISSYLLFREKMIESNSDFDFDDFEASQIEIAIDEIQKHSQNLLESDIASVFLHQAIAFVRDEKGQYEDCAILEEIEDRACFTFSLDAIYYVVAAFARKQGIQIADKPSIFRALKANEKKLGLMHSKKRKMGKNRWYFEYTFEE